MVDVESGSGRLGGSGGVANVTFSACPLTAVVCCPGTARTMREVRIWNAETLQLEATVGDGQNAIEGLCWSPDGAIIAVTQARIGRELRLMDT